MPPSIHPTAIVESGAQIGEGTVIWQWVHVMGRARIGAHCSIGQGCYVGNVSIGDGCRVQNHVSIYDGVTLEADVFLGPSCVFTNVAHPRAHVPRRGEFAPTRVRRGATIGANATILPGVTIGEYAVVGAGTTITHDVVPHVIAYGSPARAQRWACRCGEALPATLTCARCGDVYCEDRSGPIMMLELVE